MNTNKDVALLLREREIAGLTYAAYARISVCVFGLLVGLGGTGLGLSISRKIVEDHGGDIAIDSNPGQGTRINVILPAKINT